MDERDDIYSSGSEECFTEPWRHKNTKWVKRKKNLLEYKDEIKNLQELFDIFMERDEGKPALLFVVGILFIVIGFLKFGLLLTVLGFVWVSGASQSTIRTLRQIPTIDAMLPSSLLVQTKESLRYDVEDYVPVESLTRGKAILPKVNILLLGPIGAGKSSFYNTIHAVLQDRIFNVARSGSTDQSLTMKFSRYPVYSKRKEEPLRLTICDTQGLEPNHMMSSDNMRLLVEGHVPDKYPLDPSGSYSKDDPGFIQQPSLHEKMHCVVIVMDASIIDASEAIQDTLTNIRQMQKVVNKLDVPQVVVLTCIDKLCKRVNDDVSFAMKSKVVFQTVCKVSEIFGLPRHNVFPMKNYEKEGDVDPNVDILTLLTLKGILNQVDASLVRHLDEIITSYKETL